MKLRMVTLITGLVSSLALLIPGCEKNPETHDENFVITLKVLQNNVEVDTLAVNVAAKLVFEVEEEDEHGDGGHKDEDHHVSGLHLNVTIAMEGEGSHEHMEMDAHEADNEPGNYETSHTFTEAGQYEIQCGFDHDGSDVTEEFPVIVQ